MAYTIAGIDVHKWLLAVVVADLTADGEYAFERRQFGSTPAQQAPPSGACWPTGSARMRSTKP